MPKKYPLSIESLRDLDGDYVGFYSKGHHDPTEFLTEITEWGGVEIDVSPSEVYHVWWRSVPYDGDAGDVTIQFVQCAGPGPGAYPATYVEC